jgi:hypothetical protein
MQQLQDVIRRANSKGAQIMPVDDDDQHMVLKFRPVLKSRQETGRKYPTTPKADLEDMIASGAVLIALVLSIAIVSGWIPVGRYSIGAVTCFGGLAVAAKVIKARRTKVAGGNVSRQRG